MSIQCIKRPPSKALRGFASFGSTISTISDCDSFTARGGPPSGLVMDGFALGADSVSFACQPGIEEAFCHLLDACVRVRSRPCPIAQLELQIPMFSREMISFADVSHEHASVIFGGYGETYRVPKTFRGQIRATRGISQAAFVLEPVRFGSLSIIPRSRTVSLPPTTERQTRGVQ